MDNIRISIAIFHSFTCISVHTKMLHSCADPLHKNAHLPSFTSNVVASIHFSFFPRVFYMIHEHSNSITWQLPCLNIRHVIGGPKIPTSCIRSGHINTTNKNKYFDYNLIILGNIFNI